MSNSDFFNIPDCHQLLSPARFARPTIRPFVPHHPFGLRDSVAFSICGNFKVSGSGIEKERHENGGEDKSHGEYFLGGEDQRYNI